MGNIIYKQTVLQWDLRMPEVMLISVYLKLTTKFSNTNTSNPSAGAAIGMIVLAYGMDH